MHVHAVTCSPNADSGSGMLALEFSRGQPRFTFAMNWRQCLPMTVLYIETHFGREQFSLCRDLLSESAATKMIGGAMKTQAIGLFVNNCPLMQIDTNRLQLQRCLGEEQPDGQSVDYTAIGKTLQLCLTQISGAAHA